MHILLASNLKTGNLGYYAWLALKRMGHRITVLCPIESEAENRIKATEDVFVPDIVQSLPVKPDLFLYVEGSVGNRFLPRGIVELDIPTAGWLGDNYLNFRWHKEYCAMFDYAFFCQLGRMELAQKAYGYDHLHWLPFAADEQFHAELKTERDIDVGYVGSIIPDKRRFFEKLEKAGVAIQTNKTFLKNEEIGAFYSRCKIVYNICARFDVNLRTFEAPLAGALLVGQKAIDKGFYEIFTPGVNAEVHDFDDAAAIIKGCLADPERLRTMALAGQEVVRAGHTYRHRMEELLKICGGGVTARRRGFARSWQRHIKAALVYQHPHFRLKEEARKEFGEAWKTNFAGTFLYLLKYGWWRMKEKIEKTIWEMGKRPV